MRARFLLPLLVLGAAPVQQGKVLIFSHTTGYRHDSIPAGIAAISAIARRQGLVVQTSENPAIFSANGLRDVRALVLLSTTTDLKNPSSEWLVGNRRLALRSFVEAGGGVVAIHAAADSHYGWPWYAHLVGARFASHPPGTPAGTLKLADANHPVTAGLSTLR